MLFICFSSDCFFFFFNKNFFFNYYFFYCSGFCHTLKWNSHGFTCVPHPDPPSHLLLHPIPLGLPSAPGPNACLMYPTCQALILSFQADAIFLPGHFYYLISPGSSHHFLPASHAICLYLQCFTQAPSSRYWHMHILVPECPSTY